MLPPYISSVTRLAPWVRVASSVLSWIHSSRLLLSSSVIACIWSVNREGNNVYTLKVISFYFLPTQRRPSKYETWMQCCFNVGLRSATLVQHWNKIASMSRIWWGVSRRWPTNSSDFKLLTYAKFQSNLRLIFPWNVFWCEWKIWEIYPYTCSKNIHIS